jgi:hypothetical protein
MLNLNRRNFQAHPFHLVSPSPWPLYTSLSILTLTTSAVLSFHGFYYTESYYTGKESCFTCRESCFTCRESCFTCRESSFTDKNQLALL